VDQLVAPSLGLWTNWSHRPWVVDQLVAPSLGLWTNWSHRP